MNGYNGCILAYGQTGSGKTHTMEGKASCLGVNFRAIKEIFEIIQNRQSTHKYGVSISILEVYNETIRDLIGTGSGKIEIREDNKENTHIQGIKIKPVKSYQEIFSAVEKGKTNRAMGCTNMNEYSSRSHCIITLYIQSVSADKEYCSKLHLIDLAGSERVWKSEAVGLRMQEACNINQSLSALSNVLHRLGSKEKHIPYRDSKLTHLLKDSLGGDAKTLVITTVSPLPRDASETVSSLTFASRISQVEKGKAKRSEKPKKKQKNPEIENHEYLI